MPIIESPVDPSFSPETAGDRIQHARRVLAVFLGWDITQAHLADFLGVDARTVAGLEGDSVTIDRYVVPLCDALGIQREFLVSGATPMAGFLSPEARKRWTAVLHGLGAPPVVAALNSRV
jgi:hypothetical protein